MSNVEDGFEQRDNLPPIATPNLSTDYQEHIRWVSKIEEDRTCRGRIYYLAYLLWDGIGNLTPLLLIVTSVSACVAAMSRSMLMEQDLAVAATYGGAFGIMVGVALCIIDMLMFMFGAFTDSRSRYRIRNHWHKGYVVTFCIIIIVLSMSIFAIVRLFTKPKDDSDFSLKHIFIG
jgi:large-conductance mechanosensitive channel